MFLGWALCGAALAGGADRVSVSLGVAGVGAPDSGGALGAAYVSLRATDALSFDVGGRTGLLAGPLREVTGISVGGRAMLGDLVFARADLVHQHETPWDAFVEAPVSNMLGSGPSIGHRSGLDGGLGLRGTLPTGPHGTGVHVSAAALATWFPDPNGPRLYGVIETLLTLDLGRRSDDPS
jgi:hypothetical protein